MKTIYKLLFAGLFSVSLLSVAASPVLENEDAMAGATPSTECHKQGPGDHHGCPGMEPIGPMADFQSHRFCIEVPREKAFLAIDSVECSIHLVKDVMKYDSVKNENVLCREIVARFQTDNIHKRHDLKSILRPVYVGVMGEYYVVLASAVNDSSYVALLNEKLDTVAVRRFSTPLSEMRIEPGMLILKGRNPYGYDIISIPFSGCPKEFAKSEILNHHYRVAKQSEKIKNSDPVGIGLTAVAVGVVFLALVCIALILQGTGKLMSGMEEKKKKGAGQKKGGAAVKASAAAADKEDEIYAAIATAIHLYNDELHDEEDAVITIQKVEREWTPWNAKYYNMNQYFNNRR